MVVKAISILNRINTDPAGTSLIAVGAIVFVAILLLGCPAASGQISLPNGWPEAQIVPPPGSAPAQYDSKPGGKVVTSSHAPAVLGPLNSTREVWTVGYQNKSNWDAEIAYYDALLAPLGFLVLTNIPSISKNYVAADHRTFVILKYQQQHAAYVLEISVCSEPMPSSGKEEPIR